MNAENIKKLEQIENYLADNAKNFNQETINKISELLKGTTVLMLVNVEKNDGKTMQTKPLLLKTKAGEHFLPLYTSAKQFDPNAKYDRPIEIVFDEALKLVANNAKTSPLVGVCLNPFGGNFVVKLNGAPVQVPAEHLHALTRKNVEYTLLPQKLYKEGLEFLDKIDADFLHGFYSDLYVGELANPFTEDDFDVMNLKINADLSLCMITFAPKFVMAGAAQQAFLTWHEGRKEAAYYIARTPAAPGPSELITIDDKGKITVLGEAPAESARMDHIINLEMEK